MLSLAGYASSDEESDNEVGSTISHRENEVPTNGSNIRHKTSQNPWIYVNRNQTQVIEASFSLMAISN